MSPGDVFPQHDDGLVDAGEFAEGGLDFAEFDAEAAQLDLAVGASQEVEFAMWQAADEIAGAVELCAGLRRERVGDEAVGSQVGALEVSLGDAFSADVELAGYTGGYELLVCVEDVELRVVDRRADIDGA